MEGWSCFKNRRMLDKSDNANFSTKTLFRIILHFWVKMNS